MLKFLGHPAYLFLLDGLSHLDRRPVCKRREDLTNLKVQRGWWTGIFLTFEENFRGCQLLNHIEENTSCVSYFVVVFFQPIAATVLVFQSYSASPSVFHLKPDKYSLILFQPHLNLNLLLNPSSHLTRCKSCSIWEGNLWQKAFLQESAVKIPNQTIGPMCTWGPIIR